MRKSTYIVTLGCVAIATSFGVAIAANSQTGNSLQSLKKPVSGIVELNGANWWDKDESEPIIHLIVDKALQSVSVYSDGRLLQVSNVSTGKAGYETPGGIFSILSKNRRHFSNIYRGAPMPFMQRLTWSGIALHESNSVPDYPASHGCIRLPGKFAGKLFKFTERGAQVIITRQDVKPQRVSYALPFKLGYEPEQLASNLRPTTTPNASDDATLVLKNDKPLRVLLTRNSGRQQLIEIQSILNELGYDAGETDGWMGPQTGRAIRAFQADYQHQKTGALNDQLLGQLYRATGRGKPKNGHVYVRLNKKPLFDTSVVIKDEKIPLGTHHFTAVIKPQNPQAPITNSPYWLGLSIEETGWAERDENDFTAPSSPKRALARFELPEALTSRISGMLNHGSTVVISDQGISKETVSKGTDFIVLTK